MAMQAAFTPDWLPRNRESIPLPLVELPQQTVRAGATSGRTPPTLRAASPAG
jgi:hypothetical protein